MYKMLKWALSPHCRVFSAFGGMGGAATTVYKRLASLLAAKRDKSYSSGVLELD